MWMNWLWITGLASGCVRQTKTKEKSVSGSLMNVFAGKRLKHEQVSFHMWYLIIGYKTNIINKQFKHKGLQFDLMCFYICTAVLSWGQLRDRQSHRVIIIITEKHNSERPMFVCAATEKASTDHKMYFLYRCMRECMHPQTWSRKQRPPNKWMVMSDDENRAHRKTPVTGRSRGGTHWLQHINKRLLSSLHTSCLLICVWGEIVCCHVKKEEQKRSRIC